MGAKINEEIETKLYAYSSGKTITYYVYDESDSVHASGTMSEIGSSGLYTAAWTPDAAGTWTVRLDCSSPYIHTGFVYEVGRGQEADIETSIGSEFDGTPDIYDVIVTGYDSSSTTSNADGSLLERLEHLKGVVLDTTDTVLYIVAEDQTGEITDDGGSPAYTIEASKTVTTEAAAEADPAWSEDWTISSEKQVNIQSMFANLYFGIKTTGGGTGYAKWQISGDGGSNWYDMTDNLSTTTASYVSKQRMGSKKWFSTISSGTNKLKVRLCAWIDGGTSVETKVREDSYLRITRYKTE